MGRSSESTTPAAGPRATEAGYKPKDENETKRTQRARGLPALVVVIVVAHLPLLASLAGPQALHWPVAQKLDTIIRFYAVQRERKPLALT